MSIFLFFLLITAITAVSAQQRSSNISLGSFLTPTSNSSSWLSHSGLYAFGFVPQSNGYTIAIFLAGIDKTVVWTANWDNNPTVADNVVLNLTREGRLIIQQSGQPEKYVVDSTLPIASAAMLDNGNFVLHDTNRSVVWQSFDHPTNTLLPGARLVAGQELFSSASRSDLSRGIFRLIMQLDGWLVQYPANTPYEAPFAYWQAGMVAGDNVSLHLENDGYLYLLNGSIVMTNLTTGGNPVGRTLYLMRIDPDGIFRLYSHTLNGGGNWAAIWSSSRDLCSPKGLCGLNGFCVQMDDRAECRCLPSFDFIQSNNGSAGCARSSTGASCGNKDIRFEIKRVENTVRGKIIPMMLWTRALKKNANKPV